MADAFGRVSGSQAISVLAPTAATPENVQRVQNVWNQTHQANQFESGPSSGSTQGGGVPSGAGQNYTPVSSPAKPTPAPTPAETAPVEQLSGGMVRIGQVEFLASSNPNVYAQQVASARAVKPLPTDYVAQDPRYLNAMGAALGSGDVGLAQGIARGDVRTAKLNEELGAGVFPSATDLTAAGFIPYTGPSAGNFASGGFVVGQGNTAMFGATTLVYIPGLKEVFEINKYGQSLGGAQVAFTGNVSSQGGGSQAPVSASDLASAPLIQMSQLKQSTVTDLKIMSNPFITQQGNWPTVSNVGKFSGAPVFGLGKTSSSLVLGSANDLTSPEGFIGALQYNAAFLTEGGEYGKPIYQSDQSAAQP